MMFGPTQAKRRISFLMILLVLALGVWTYGLISFVDLIPDKAVKADQTTDAIVVLTGGSDRLKEGLTLLTNKKAKKLFVSGVYRGNDVKRLLAIQQYNPAELMCCINLGYAATSTAGNALETAIWINEQKYRSLRLVTANYHMPRSLLEFHHIMPDVEILPHPVFPEQFKRDRWWQWPGTATLIISEYTKYNIASALKNLGNLKKMWQVTNDGSPNK
ncbi:MAG: YdcF family protein [Rhodospirillaceae bacterium]|nr:YdcF family protein [Rhodospirillaceae bacterium]MBT4589982.1 YdcF family protein [Rhodospirillaceae bacterium]MBT4940840.1 YdcF family protein [Rhodospirillaceae bacterium]MBT5940769.1 YdcF family protein [Rhodospirillaceae bacterium]MBT7265304.1 YdcF family protein [Rhodospirillaceae bacterium]